MARSYPKEKRELAVRMVLDHRGEYPSLTSACLHIAPKLDIGHATLHRWVLQAEIAMGLRGGQTSEESAQIAALKRENRELREANEILRRPRFSSRRSSTLETDDHEVIEGRGPRCMGSSRSAQR
jgi:transposase